jgi:hypothetical protein
MTEAPTLGWNDNYFRFKLRVLQPTDAETLEEIFGQLGRKPALSCKLGAIRKAHLSHLFFKSHSFKQISQSPLCGVARIRYTADPDFFLAMWLSLLMYSAFDRAGIPIVQSS